MVDRFAKTVKNLSARIYYALYIIISRLEIVGLRQILVCIKVGEYTVYIDELIMSIRILYVVKTSLANLCRRFTTATSTELIWSITIVRSK